MKKKTVIAGILASAILVLVIVYCFVPSKAERDNAAFIQVLKNKKNTWLFQADGLGDNAFIAPMDYFNDYIWPIILDYEMESITSFDSVRGTSHTKLFGCMNPTSTIK